jgi:hypothetical protein
LGGFQAELAADLGGSRVTQLIRVPAMGLLPLGQLFALPVGQAAESSLVAFTFPSA